MTDAGGTVLVVGPAAGRLLRVVRATGRRAGRLSARHEVRFARYDAIVRRVLRFRVAVLRVIELLAHHVVQRAAPEVQYLLERPPEVPVQRRVYHLRHTRRSRGIRSGGTPGIGVSVKSHRRRRALPSRGPPVWSRVKGGLKRTPNLRVNNR